VLLEISDIRIGPPIWSTRGQNTPGLADGVVFAGMISISAGSWLAGRLVFSIENLSGRCPGAAADR
jgi:hypothetical protein